MVIAYVASVVGERVEKYETHLQYIRSRVRPGCII